MQLKRIDPKQLECRPFQKIADQWMLITGGDASGFNTMTASWGGLGTLWSRPVTFSFIRPSRYTYEFAERCDLLTFSFFPEENREALKICGYQSGRNIDKVKETGLTPAFTDDGAVYFEEAELVIVSKKIYYSDIVPEQISKMASGMQAYVDGGDYHRLYIGEVVEVLERK